MELLKYVIALLVLHSSNSQNFYYKQNGNVFDVYYGPTSLQGYQEMISPKSFKPFYDQRRVRPGKCKNGNFNCTEDYPYIYTKNFECQYDYQCPKYFKCCQPKCFSHKVCQPLTEQPFDQLTTPQEVVTITPEQLKTTKSQQSGSTIIPTTTVTTTTHYTTELVPTTSFTTIPSSTATTEKTTLTTTTTQTHRTTEVVPTTTVTTSTSSPTTTEAIVITTLSSPESTTTTSEITTTSSVTTVTTSVTPSSAAPTTQEITTEQKITTTQTPITTKSSSARISTPSLSTTVQPITTSAEITPSLAANNFEASTTLQEQAPTTTTLKSTGPDKTTSKPTEETTTIMKELIGEDKKSTVESTITSAIQSPPIPLNRNTVSVPINISELNESKKETTPVSDVTENTRVNDNKEVAKKTTTRSYKTVSDSEAHITDITSTKTSSKIIADHTESNPTSTISPDEAADKGTVTDIDQYKKVTIPFLDITEVNQTRTLSTLTTDDEDLDKEFGSGDREGRPSVPYFDESRKVTTTPLNNTALNRNRNVPIDDEELVAENGSGEGAESLDNKTQKTTTAAFENQTNDELGSGSTTRHPVTTDFKVNETDFEFITDPTILSKIGNITTGVTVSVESKKVATPSSNFAETSQTRNVSVPDDEDMVPEIGSGDGTDLIDDEDMTKETTPKYSNERDDDNRSNSRTKDFATTKVPANDTEFEFISVPTIASQTDDITRVSVSGQSVEVTKTSSDFTKTTQTRNFSVPDTDDEDLVAEIGSGAGTDVIDEAHMTKKTTTAKSNKETDDEILTDSRTKDFTTTKVPVEISANDTEFEFISISTAPLQIDDKTRVSVSGQSVEVTTSSLDLTETNKTRNIANLNTDDEDLVSENGSGDGSEENTVKSTTKNLATTKTPTESFLNDTAAGSIPASEVPSDKPATKTDFEKAKNVTITGSDIEEKNKIRNISMLETDDEDLISGSGSGDGADLFENEAISNKTTTAISTIETDAEVESVSKTRDFSTTKMKTTVIAATTNPSKKTATKTITITDLTNTNKNTNMSMLDTDDEDFSPGSGSGDSVEYYDTEEDNVEDGKDSSTEGLAPTEGLIHDKESQYISGPTVPQVDTSKTKVFEFDESKKVTTANFKTETNTEVPSHTSTKNFVPTETPKKNIEINAEENKNTEYNGSVTEVHSNILLNETDDEDFIEGSGAGADTRKMSKDVPTKFIIPFRESNDDESIEGSGAREQILRVSPSTSTQIVMVEHSDLDDFDIDDSYEGREREPSITTQKNIENRNEMGDLNEVKKIVENSIDEKDNATNTRTNAEHKETEITDKPTLEEEKEMKNVSETTTTVVEESNTEFQELKVVMSTSIPYNVGTTLDRSLFFPSKEEPPKRILKIKKEKVKSKEYNTENSDSPSYSAEGNKNNQQRTTVKVSAKEKESFVKENGNYEHNDEEDYLTENSGSGDYSMLLVN